MKEYEFVTPNFEATVLCKDQQGACDLLFAFLLKSSLGTFRFSLEDIRVVNELPEGSTTVGVMSFFQVRTK